MAAAHKEVVVGVLSWSPHGRGRRRAISRSKRRNKIATRKKRSEKGRRAVPKGSKPHSYGDNFSLSGLRFGSQNVKVKRIREMRVVMAMADIIRFITFPWSLTKIK